MSLPVTFICLVRGINVGGRNVISMAELRSACSDLGWTDVQSYIQSGNIVLSVATSPAILEAKLEEEIQLRFGIKASVLARTATDWQTCIEGNPFHAESLREPNLVMLALSKALPKPEAVEILRARAASGEQIARVGDALWIHYAGGAGRSRLSPGLLDRIVGSPVTTRNWRTVVKLGELARGSR